MKKKTLSAILCTALILPALCGCGGSPNVTKLSVQGAEPGYSGALSAGQSDDISQSGSPKDNGSGHADFSDRENTQPADAATVMDFTVRLFQQSLLEQQKEGAGENLLISPVSVLYALSMTANGANGRTLEQMEAVLGSSVPELNTYLHQYRSTLPTGEGYKLSLANSIWFRDDQRLTVNTDFLAANEKWYGADIYKAPFDDSTVKAINNWVSEATDKMIPEILDEIPKDVVMYLINGLAFDAEWASVFEWHDVRKSDFTEEDGTKYKAELMHSTESVYLQDENAQGFLKYYKDKKYAFAALLPNEGTSIADYAAALDGKTLQAILSNPVNTSVNIAIPKFKTEYDIEMSELFIAMGMTDAFDGTTADLSGIGSSTAGNLFIDHILHKTFIAVDERGTKAGAATAVAISDECATLTEREVILNRPFVYMIVDCEENVPVFIGTVMSVR